MRHYHYGENAVAKGTPSGSIGSHQCLFCCNAKYFFRGVAEVGFCSLFDSGLYHGDILDQERDACRIVKHNWLGP